MNKPPYKGVRGKGTARILEEVNFNLGIWEKIMARYLGNLEDPQFDLREVGKLSRLMYYKLETG